MFLRLLLPNNNEIRRKEERNRKKITKTKMSVAWHWGIIKRTNEREKQKKEKQKTKWTKCRENKWKQINR